MPLGLILTLALSVVREVVKNPKKKASLKKRLLELRDVISAIYAGEE